MLSGKHTRKRQGIFSVCAFATEITIGCVIMLINLDMESRNRFIFCESCVDFIYDHGLEKLCGPGPKSENSGQSSRDQSKKLGVLGTNTDMVNLEKGGGQLMPLQKSMSRTMPSRTHALDVVLGACGTWDRPATNRSFFKPCFMIQH